MTRHAADDFLARALVIPPDLHKRRQTRAALVCIAAVFAALMAGVWIGQGITEFNHIRLEAGK
jgi:hypothetical protein